MTSPDSRGTGAQVADFCSLPSEALDERRARIRREIAPLVSDCVDVPGGVAWIVAPDVARSEARAKLEDLAALERACCGEHLELAVRDDGSGGRLALEVRGPEAAAFRAVVETALAAPDPPDAPRDGPRRVARLAKAVGAGLGGALVLCCALPLAAAAVVGAAPLLALDTPWVVAPVALAPAALVYALDRRRAAARAAAACGCRGRRG